MIEIHPTAKISQFADIEDSVRGTSIKIGPETIIDAFVKFKPAGGTGDILIDEKCVINSGCVFYSGNGVQIGKGVAIASNCTFAPVNHEFSKMNIPIMSQGFRPSKGGIIIEDDVWIGANCVLLDGAKLCQGSVIAAGSVVRGEVEAYKIVGGNPLKILGERK
jgi:virginiamycin A acetyltransferase